MDEKAFDLGLAIDRAFKAWKAHASTFTSATLAAGLLLFACASPFLLAIADAFGWVALDMPEWWLPLMAIGAAMLVGLVGTSFQVGLTLMSLHALRGVRPTSDQMRPVLDLIVPAFVAHSLADVAMRFGFLACCVPGFMLAAGLLFVQLLVVDQRLSPFAALNASWRMTQGQLLQVLLLIVVAWAILAAGTLALVVGLLVAVPVVSLVTAAVYEQLRGRVGPVRVLPGDTTRPPPAEPASCASCADAVPDGSGRTCAGCGARYHDACAGGRCLVEGCAQTLPTHIDWTREARAKGPWFEVAARPVSIGLRIASLIALLLALAFSDSDTVELVSTQMRTHIPDAEVWMTISAAISLAVVPWLALGVLTVHEHRAHRRALVDANGVVLDWSPTWAGTRVSWRELRGFALETDGVQVAWRGWLGGWLGPTLAVREEDRPRLVELLEQEGVRRLDA